MIPMELTSVYKSPVSVHEITYIYCYQSIHQETNVKYKTKVYDYKKEVGDIDFFIMWKDCILFMKMKNMLLLI